RGHSGRPPPPPPARGAGRRWGGGARPCASSRPRMPYRGIPGGPRRDEQLSWAKHPSRYLAALGKFQPQTIAAAQLGLALVELCKELKATAATLRGLLDVQGNRCRGGAAAEATLYSALQACLRAHDAEV
ncbi:unnamed protein product, partial [Prorocentrum cordatum]